MSSADLVLDWRIRVWVLLPISLATILMSLLRVYISQMLFQRPRTSVKKTRAASAIARANSLAASASSLHPTQFHARRAYLLSANGPLRKEDITSSSPLSVFMNPDNIGNQVASLISSLIPQMLLGAWVRYFFSGFAVAKLPFPLSQRFRSMLQSGIERAGQSLDVSYVSALSWYILNLFGNSAIVRLIQRQDMDESGSKTNSSSMRNLAQELGSAFQGANSARETARTKLQAVDHYYSLPAVETRLLRRNPEDFAIPVEHRA